MNIYESIQKTYDVYKRKKPQSEEIVGIDLNKSCDIAYLICMLKRDIRKHCKISNREKNIMIAQDLWIKQSKQYLNSFELYSMKLHQGFVYDALNKQIVRYL